MSKKSAKKSTKKSPLKRLTVKDLEGLEGLKGGSPGFGPSTGEKVDKSNKDKDEVIKSCAAY